MNRLLTFSQRASQRGGRALVLLFCACVALGSGCSKDYQQCIDCPGTSALKPGTFALVAVEGSSLPYSLPNTSVTFLDGTCVTTSDEKFTLNVTTVTGKDTVAAASGGFVLALNTGSVTFSFVPSAVRATALLTGNGFVLAYNGLNLSFERVP